MSIKTTQRITRANALAVLLSEIPLLPNEALAEMMNALADTERSSLVSRFDNFIVSDGFRVDHINGDPTDNDVRNLRIVEETK